MPQVCFKPITLNIEMNHVRNALREDIFSMWRHDFFVLRDVHSQRVYLQEESLSCRMRPKKKLLRICPERILFSADKQRPCRVFPWHTKSGVSFPLEIRRVVNNHQGPISLKGKRT